MGVAVTVAAAKTDARVVAFARRKAAHGAVDPASAQAVVAGLLAAQPAGRVVALYDPIRTEIDPRPAVAGAAGRLALAMPVIAGPGQPLMFREWTPGAPMTTGPFGVAVPASGRWCEPDILIVPMLAFDGLGYRLGYGGGFYDRTLARLRGNGGHVQAIGIAYAAQRTDSLPRDATDQPLDAIVTEQGLHRFARCAG